VRIRIFAMLLVLLAGMSGPIAHAQIQGSVANATFTANVVDGAPVDFRQQFANTAPVVYYYGELLDLTGQTVKMRWRLEGKPMQETLVTVTRARQPSWSMMKMQPQWTGNWTVEVLNSKGQVIDSRNFAFNPPL
jgi:hypothetical protein